MTKATDTYRVEYGIRPARPKATGLGRWMLAVTLILCLALAGHYIYWTATQPMTSPAAPADYSDWWRHQLAGTPPPDLAPAAISVRIPEPASTPPVPVPSAPDPEAAADILRYFPLDTGHWWRYAAVRERNGGAPEPLAPVLFRVIEADRSGGRLLYHCTLNGLPLEYQIEGVALKVRRQSGETGIVHLEAPLLPGSRWDTPDAASRTEVTGTGRITVPAGSWECLILTRGPAANGPGERMTVYYAPGIGPVKQVTQHGLLDRTVWELTGYLVNGEQGGMAGEEDSATPAE